MRLQRLPMVGLFYTTEPMMAAANAAALDLEQRDGVLSVSLIHGFMWADMPEMGAGVLVIVDGNCIDDLEFDLSAEVGKVAAAFFGARGETRALRQSVGAILDRIETAVPDPANRPFVVADTDDNAGGGAGSDSTFILEAVLARGLRGYALALLWDPIVVEFATIAGVGTTFKLRLGGKTGPQAGRPLDVVATVLAIRCNLTQFGIGFSAPMGTVAALEIAGNIVIVNDVRGQVFSPTCFTDLGVELSRQRAIIVKSTQHFHDQFEPLAREILYCETAGSLSLVVDPASYRHLRRPIWPVDDVVFVA
jgi:microcystin degradation protein MlrC